MLRREDTRGRLLDRRFGFQVDADFLTAAAREPTEDAAFLQFRLRQVETKRHLQSVSRAVGAVYVFADTVEAIDTEDGRQKLQSVANPLSAMFVRIPETGA
jgi:hypothetical protein